MCRAIGSGVDGASVWYHATKRSFFRPTDFASLCWRSNVVKLRWTLMVAWVCIYPASKMIQTAPDLKSPWPHHRDRAFYLFRFWNLTWPTLLIRPLNLTVQFSYHYININRTLPCRLSPFRDVWTSPWGWQVLATCIQPTTSVLPWPRFK